MKVLFSGDLRMLYKKAGWENKSCEIYPLIDSTHDTFCANLYDTTISNRAIAREPEDIDKTQAAQDMFDWCFSITKAEDVREEIRNEASLIGTSYGMPWFEKKKGTKKYMQDGVEKSEEYDIIKPTLEKVSFFELFYPMSTDNFYKAQWKFRRKILQFKDVECK